MVKAIKVSELPSTIAPYAAAHYKEAKIKEAGRLPMPHVKPCTRQRSKAATSPLTKKEVLLKKIKLMSREQVMDQLALEKKHILRLVMLIILAVLY
jgi:hypothetical protein